MSAMDPNNGGGGWLAQHQLSAIRLPEPWLEAQRQAFEAAMSGATPAISLAILTKVFSERAEADARCAFYMTNPEHTGLFHVAGMPEDYARVVDGFAIGPESLACGLAAFTGEPVLTPDVSLDPRWVQWRRMAKQFGYRT
jgi:hypothetical protein